MTRTAPHHRAHATGPNGLEAAAAPEAVRLLVRGFVQGVGFRPFVYRLANELRLGGHVVNTSAGVMIELEGSRDAILAFQQRLPKEAPAAAHVDSVNLTEAAPSGRTNFRMDFRQDDAAPEARVPHDLAICLDCRRDIVEPSNRRHAYPFTNCTACGPRYSIIAALPYDRTNTVMRQFTMCAACQEEYTNPRERRLHAQPNACAACGPRVALWDPSGEPLAGSDTALAAAARLLRLGRIVALKGLGGFQLLVRADEAAAVRRLRERKHRPSKPLAVMAASLEAAERLAVLSPTERRLLQSAVNVIVIAAQRADGAGLADLVAPNSSTIGLFLPTTPLHEILLAAVDFPVVATSGNRGAEPMVTDEHDAIGRLAGIADALLVHDRPIVRGLDDSVVRVIASQPVTLRLARGLAPLPLPALEALARRHGAPPMLATGGHQKCAVAVWTGAQAILTQHIGDLDNADARAAFERVTRDLGDLYHFEPAALACDLHPSYFTTTWAFAQRQPVTQVQHHHAHAVACLVEHDLLDRTVLAVTWDGTGFGLDGSIWGGETLRADGREFQRHASLLPFPLPGGAAAIRHPNRAAFGLLWVLRGPEAALRDHATHHRLGLTESNVHMLSVMIRRGLNTPWTSSVGRLFDGVAALALGLDEATYEGEAAMRLESVADADVTDAYPLPLVADPDSDLLRGDWRPLLSALLADRQVGAPASTVAAKFHNSLARWAASTAVRQPLRDVVLGGGCFQNRLLAERTSAALADVGCRVYLPGRVPPGDGGLAAGQLGAALAQWAKR